jgi:putative hydrolase of the HAD superfamily
LPGRKLVFSNSPVHYSRAVLALLRVADIFDGVFCIEQTKYRPSRTAGDSFICCISTGSLRARCIMVEDSPDESA